VTEIDPVDASAPPRDRIPDAAYARMALLLRVGLAASLIAIVAAIAAYLTLHPQSVWTASEANPAGEYLSLDGLARGLASGSPVAFLTLGILILVATPILRVVTGLYYFGRHGERSIATIAAVVLALLLLGILVLGPLIR